MGSYSTEPDSLLDMTREDIYSKARDICNKIKGKINGAYRTLIWNLTDLCASPILSQRYLAREKLVELQEIGNNRKGLNQLLENSRDSINLAASILQEHGQIDWTP